MQFSLRTLIIVMLFAGPLGAWGWKEWQAYRVRRSDEEARAQIKWKTARTSGFATIMSKRTKSGAPASPAADEIWLQQRDSIRWESFPESQPATP